MRLIDADKLKAYKCSICDNRERCKDREQVCSEIAEIDEQPTIEAEPVKHGRWILYGRIDNYKEFICSACLEIVTSNKLKFCPSCGAKMKEDNHEADKNNK